MADRRRLIVKEAEQGTRLDVFLQEYVDEFSRSWLQKLIKRGEVSVDGEQKQPSYQLKKGERVVAQLVPPPQISLEPQASISPEPQVVFEHKDFLIINKPSGVVVHPAETTPDDTLVNWLLAHYPDIKDVGEESFRPGIVHRLDKGTSGLMVVARTQDSFMWLKKQFKERAVHKTYTTLVSGQIEEDEGEVTWPIGRAKSDPTKQRAYKKKAQAPPNARRALTQWRVVQCYPDFTLVEASPVTGRMHQIRVHMRALGHPVVGDAKYTTKRATKLKTLGRLFLHASKLRFTGPQGEVFSFTSPLPKELERALRNIKYVI